ncbi:efflux RND transporter periplasmic adaptor subunit [Zhengella sp. ZM62]|uniref:efflux RND transporter periplasmic adaptor subunit n=1 Tax=Zhengella sedimenti TaxID=3390035 RepID=UPI0039757D2B
MLLEIEGGLREAQSEAELGQYIVDETGRILRFAGTCYLLLQRAWKGHPVLSHATGVSSPDRQSPLAASLEAAVARNAGLLAAGRPAVLPFDEPLAGSGKKRLLAIPLRIIGGRTAGVLAIPVSKAPGDADQLIAARLASAYGHALTPFARSLGRQALVARRRQIAMALALAGMLSLFIPVPLTVLAPAEVVPRDPFVVAAPVDGVIRRLLVDPNQSVAAGELLAEFDDTEPRGRYDVAARALDIASARERRTRQGAFASQDMRRELAIAEAERRMAEAELAEARDRLERTRIRAPAAGIVLYSNRDDWTGKPVSTGERIMRIADPNRLRLRIELAIGDTVALDGDGSLRLFLDAAPLAPVLAKVETAAYLAEPTPDNRLVYPVLAAIEDGAVPLRPGLRGTAQIYGPRVSLGYYLFRRPIALLRQRFGI